MARRLVVLLMVSVAQGAVAATDPTSDTPWSRGVSAEQQREALALFREGNVALREGLTARASTRYREALTQWDHPAIHFNLAVALRAGATALVLHRHLTAALRHGAAALGPEAFDQAMRMLSQVERQLTKLKVRCAVDGAQVRLDGVLLFTGPGVWDELVPAGPHHLTASKQDIGVEEKTVTLLGGDATSIELTFLKAAETIEYHRPFSALIPWSATAVTAVSLGLGIWLHSQARTSFSLYDDGIRGCADASAPAACLPSLELQRQLAIARSAQSSAYALYAVSGVAALASVTLFYLGRPVAVKKSIQVPWAVAPVLTPTLVGTTFQIGF